MAHAPSTRAPDIHHHPHDAVTTLSVPIGRRCCQACAALVEQRLRQNPHVLQVHVDPAHGVVHVTARAGTTSVDELARLVGECCGDRCPVPLPDAAVSSHDHAHTASPDAVTDAPEARAAAHAEHAGMAHAGHDMSDPRMAAAMEADMRRRFWISLVLALPVLAYSSLASGLLGLRLPTPFGVPMDWMMLVFATPVALWTGSVFHIGILAPSTRSRVAC